MRILILLALVIGVKGTDCPDLSWSDENGFCISSEFSYISRDEVSNACARDGAYLPTILNAFQNNALAQQTNYGNVWLGLTCLNNSITSCQWANGIPMTSSSYNNFAGFKPVVENGPCVYMEVEGELWKSADCSNDQVFAYCIYTPNTTILYCDQHNEYNGFDTLFRGKCYRTVNVNTAADSISICTSLGYRPVSIHSEGENLYVRDFGERYGLYYGPPEITEIFLAILQNGTWADGTPVDYQNYGDKYTPQGSCVSMSLNGDPVPAGQWYKSACNTTKPAFAICVTDPVLPDPIVMSPGQCTETMVHTGYGTIYSPGYPEKSEPNHCEYVITQEAGSIVQITLKKLKLDKNSTLKLFHNKLDQIPFQILTNINIKTDLVIRSTTNSLKIIYDTSKSAEGNNEWSADYQPIGKKN